MRCVVSHGSAALSPRGPFATTPFTPNFNRFLGEVDLQEVFEAGGGASPSASTKDSVESSTGPSLK